MQKFYWKSINVMIAGMLSFFCAAQIASAGGHGETNAFSFTLIVPEAEVEKVEALLASHREFMKETHSVDGDMQTRLNSYSVIKAA